MALLGPLTTPTIEGNGLAVTTVGLVLAAALGLSAGRTATPRVANAARDQLRWG